MLLHISNNKKVVFVKNYILILTALVSISVLTSALSVQTNSNTAQIFAGQTTGYIKIWFTNNQTENVNYYVNVQSQLEASVNPASGSLQPGETGLTEISIQAPACFEGVFHVLTTVQFSDGEFQTIDTPVRVVNQIQCDNYIQNSDYSQTSFPSSSNSALQPIKSTINFETYFNPTYYNIRIISQTTVVSNNVQSVIPIKIINEGASSSFQFILINADPNLNVKFNENSFNLLTNEVETVYMSVKPENLNPGTYPIEIEVTQGQQVVSDTTVYVLIKPVYTAQLVLPKSVFCQNQIQGSVTNTGNAEDTYVLSSNGVLNQTVLTLSPGETGFFSVESENQTQIIVEAKSANVQGSATTNINCTNLVELPKILVTNNNNYTLPNVTVTATNIPTGWSVLSEPAVDMQPGESKNFTVYLRETTLASDVQPIVLVESNGKVISQQEMPVLNRSLSGYVTGVIDNNLALIGVIVFIAILIAVYSTRAKLEEVEEQSYQQKIQSIKNQISAQK